MLDHWRLRAFTQDEASNLAGLRNGTLRVWLHRLKGVECLFSEKRGSRRWYSTQDVAVLAIARALERGGMSHLLSVGTAFELLQEPPAEDAILVIDIGEARLARTRIISDRDVSRLAVDRNTQLVPLGKIVADVRDRCDAKYKEST